MLKIKTQKVYFKGYKISREDGKVYLAEGQANGEWTLQQLDDDGDVYGYKEWVDTCDTLRECKSVAKFCH